jgi:chromosome segregation ATPase
MTPTPRTDAAWEDALRLPGGGFTCKPNMTGLAMEMSKFARQLERENQTFRAAQKACEDCDAPRVDRIAELERELADQRAHSETIYNAAVDLAHKLERDLESCRVSEAALISRLDDAKSELAETAKNTNALPS